MSNFLSFLLAATSTTLPFTSLDVVQPEVVVQQRSFCKISHDTGYKQFTSLYQIEEMLNQKEANLSSPVIQKVLTALKCASENQVYHNNILTIIDYSLPSNQKRLWVFDLKESQLLYYTYVSHGIKSGTLLTDNFSNKYNSRASSIGVYRTEQSYYGREGLSLRLQGLDRAFNDNAGNRAIVMHGGWYVEEPFIKKYGRPGRSWGCPALPPDSYQGIINTIKDEAFMVAYYPSDQWFNQSKFLTCEGQGTQQNLASHDIQPAVNETREDVLLASVNKQYKSESNEAIITIKADQYEPLFHNKAPLGRMLRRQIDKSEYIALSKSEFNQLFITKNPEIKVDEKTLLVSVYFVVPVIKMHRGYYETHMEIVNFGPIKEVRLASDAASPKGQSTYTVYFENKPALQLKSTDRFIRWLGL